MTVFHQYDYIFAIGMLFAFLDAWNIGANDVANSFATSVSSRSLTMKQAMMIATVTEFAGAVLAGARVSDAIRSKILSVKAFEQDPAILMLGMMCALVASSTYLTFATRVGLPVSTTHCIVGGVIGVGVASVGVDGVQWGWSGVAQVFATWAIAPGIAGCFGAIVFTLARFAILERKNSTKYALMSLPIWFGVTAAVLTMLIVWKGTPSLNLDDWSAGQTVGCIFGVGAGVTALVSLFLYPYLYRQLAMNDWQLKKRHMIQGPLLLRRGPVPERPQDEQVEIVRDYYKGHKTRAELEASGVSHAILGDVEKNMTSKDEGVKPTDSIEPVAASSSSPSSTADNKSTQPRPEQKSDLEFLDLPTWSARGLYLRAKYYFFHGVNVDVVAEQNKDSILSGDIDAMHAQVKHYDNKTEHVFTYLQVLTAAASSFAHGSNDVSNAIGPLATIFLIWNTGELSSKSPVPVWVLVYGGSAIVIGLWTYGYNIMRMLGNRITLHSPSRGFSMEFGSALTVVMATRLALPVSTTQCITGATVGVGLCAGTWRSINWRMVAWIYGGWIITLPCTGVIAGCLMGIIINAPRWGYNG